MDKHTILYEMQDNCLHNFNDDICTTCGYMKLDNTREYKELDSEQLLPRYEELKDLFTPYGRNNDELTELLEIERELTLREE